ncbi:MAG: hypothetical protein PF450_06500 [Bacteroidales bacterium]|nr:hypothetical protein [Bacteroidales bacterium]
MSDTKTDRSGQGVDGREGVSSGLTEQAQEALSETVTGDLDGMMVNITQYEKG